MEEIRTPHILLKLYYFSDMIEKKAVLEMLHKGHGCRHSRAMGHTDMLHFEFFDFCNGLLELIRIGTKKMGPAYDSMDSFFSCNLPGIQKGVDHPVMGTSQDHDQSF